MAWTAKPLPLPCRWWTKSPANPRGFPRSRARCSQRWRCSNRLHVDVLRFAFIKLGYILQIPLQRSVIFLQSWSSTGYFSNSTGSSVTKCRFSMIIAYPILRCMLSYTNDQQTSPLVSIHDTWRWSALTDIGMSMFSCVMRCMPMLHNGLQVD